jgi:hypothetical protein
MQIFAIQNIWRPENNLGIDCINRQIQKYVANHNKAGPKNKTSKNEDVIHSTFLHFSRFIFHHINMFCMAKHLHISKSGQGGVAKLLF